MTDTPQPVDAYSLWHPKQKYGLAVPMLYPSELIAVARLKALGLWPLRDGWQLIRVRVTPCQS